MYRRKRWMVTNGTLIRYMDDEHLAQVIRCPYMNSIQGRHCERNRQECPECKLEWLRKEAEYGKTDQEG